MLDRLIASSHRRAYRPLVPSSTVAVLMHAGVCVAAVLATPRPHRVSGGEGPPIVISWPLPSEDGSHADFEVAARAFVLSAMFRPGRTHGRAVRVLVRLPMSFTLTPTR